MSGFKERPRTLKLFEPANPEYVLADTMESEIFEIVSPNLLWWSFQDAATEVNRDELDTVYGENVSAGANVYTTEPIRVYGYFEINPILQEITRMGIEQIEEINIFTNINDFFDKTGVEPRSGDVFRMDFIDKNNENALKRNFYTVGSVTPTDLYHFKYLTWQVYAEMTNLTFVPDIIKDYTDLPEELQ